MLFSIVESLCCSFVNSNTKMHKFLDNQYLLDVNKNNTLETPNMRSDLIWLSLSPRVYRGMSKLMWFSIVASWCRSFVNPDSIMHKFSHSQYLFGCNDNNTLETERFQIWCQISFSGLHRLSLPPQVSRGMSELEVIFYVASRRRSFVNPDTKMHKFSHSQYLLDANDNAKHSPDINMTSVSSHCTFAYQSLLTLEQGVSMYILLASN